MTLLLSPHPSRISRRRLLPPNRHDTDANGGKGELRVPRQPPSRQDCSRQSAVSALRVLVVCCCCLLLLLLPTTEASAAGTETLVGIVGRDFVLLGADSSVSQSIALTASNLDKIAHLVDPFPGSRSRSRGDGLCERQQAILAAAAGDAADSDRLLGYLGAIGSLEEHASDGPFGCDVVRFSLDDDDDDDNDNGNDEATPDRYRYGSGGLTVREMAHLTRRCIWERLRSRTPYKVCLLVAGMMPGERKCTGNDDGIDSDGEEPVAFLSKGVQKQVRQARRSRRSGGSKEEEDEEDEGDDKALSVAETHETKSERSNGDDEDENDVLSRLYWPALYWLDEYGSLQALDYGAHGHGSNFVLSILDQHYKPDLSRAEALHLMNECFRELRNRYVINSPEAPCIKCVDAHGVTVLPAAHEVEPKTGRGERTRTTSTTRPAASP